MAGDISPQGALRVKPTATEGMLFDACFYEKLGEAFLKESRHLRKKLGLPP
jgi:hypothetical protein